MLSSNSNSRFHQFPIPFLILRRPIVWYNSPVKMILAIALLLASPALLALPPVVLSLPPVVFDDAETATNAPFVAWREDVREFSFSLECMGGPEDNVQISFGTDSNTNGILDLAECELTVGWDSGFWFVQHGFDGMERFVAEASAGSSERSVEWLTSLNASAVPRGLSIVADGSPLFPELSGTFPRWTYSPAWNMMRLTGRGTDSHGEGFSQRVCPARSGIILR